MITEDELLPKDSTYLDAINIYFAGINMPNSNKDEYGNALSVFSFSTLSSHFLHNNLQVLS